MTPKKKPIILAIVGDSGSGKTTLSFFLNSKLSIPAICSYTTRPMREGEVNGKDHWFVPGLMTDPKDALAYTFFGGHHYWSLPSQVEEVCCYVIDEKGLEDLNSRWSDKFQVISIYIDRPNKPGISKTRKERDLERTALDMLDYDLVLVNQGQLDRFISRAIKSITEILKRYGCTF